MTPPNYGKIRQAKGKGGRQEGEGDTELLRDRKSKTVKAGKKREETEEKAMRER